MVTVGLLQRQLTESHLKDLHTSVTTHRHTLAYNACIGAPTKHHQCLAAKPAFCADCPAGFVCNHVPDIKHSTRPDSTAHVTAYHSTAVATQTAQHSMLPLDDELLCLRHSLHKYVYDVCMNQDQRK